MKTTKLITVVLLLVTIATYGQHAKGKTASKKKTTTKKTAAKSETSKAEPEKTAVVSSKPEIDKLAEKYKDTPTVSFSTSHGELTGNVAIEKNPEGKPQSVSISCDESTNKKAIVEFIVQMIKQKQQQGYKSFDKEPYDEAKITSLLDLEEVNVTLKKDNMYFLVKAKGDYGYRYKATTHFWFSIETGDNQRKVSKTAAKKLDF